MVMWSYGNPTRRRVTMMTCLFGAGVSLFVVGAYLSFTNIEPQQARVKARNEYIKKRIRKYLDD